MSASADTSDNQPLFTVFKKATIVHRAVKRTPALFSGAGPPNPGGAKETFINFNHSKYLLFFGYLVEIN